MSLPTYEDILLFEAIRRGDSTVSPSSITEHVARGGKNKTEQLGRIKATLQYYKRWDEHDGTARDLDSVACRAVDHMEFVVQDFHQENNELAKKLNHMAGDIERLQNVVELFKLACEEPPAANCSCHISPPCNDCIQHACAREAWAAARAL